MRSKIRHGLTRFVKASKRLLLRLMIISLSQKWNGFCRYLEVIFSISELPNRSCVDADVEAVDGPPQPPLTCGQLRCQQTYFQRRECRQGMPSNGWYCARCFRFRTLSKEDKLAFRERMAGKLDMEEVTRVNTWRHGVGAEPDDVLGTAFNIPVTQAKFSCLRDGSWINDEVINLMMMILGAKYFSGARPSKLFTSFFFFNLAERDRGYNYFAVRRWTKYPHGDEFPCKQVGTTRWLNIFLFDKVYIPINVSNMHWFLCVLDMRKKIVRFIDNLEGTKTKYFTALCRWIDDERRKLELEVDDSEPWRMEIFFDGPRQLNGIDCGVFTLAAAEMEMMNLPHLYDQSMMPWLRLRIGNDIITHCISKDLKD